MGTPTTGQKNIMSYNLKKASEEKYPIQINGKLMELRAEQIGALIKKKMRGDLAVQKLFEEFEVSLDQLENLKIEIKDLNGRYAETDLEFMVLDEGLFSDGKFFKNNWFVVVHELVHFCSRFREKNSYFSDPEEVSGFVFSIATELARGTSMDKIWNLIFPRIEFHFNDSADSKEFFVNCIQKAQKILCS